MNLTSIKGVKVEYLYTPLTGNGGYYEITFTDFPNGSYALGVPVSVFATQNSISSIRTNQMEGETGGASTIYPNPAHRQALYSIHSNKKQLVLIELVNAGGQIVQVQKASLNLGNTNVTINTSLLISGSYLVRVKNENGDLLDVKQILKK